MNGADPAAWIRPVEKQSLSEQAYRGLREALMRGELQPGTVLTLRPLSQRFGISATPMREALMRLVAENALRLDSRGRTCVPYLTRGILMEIRGIREHLEGNAAAEAARVAVPKDIDALEDMHRRMIAAQDAGDFAEAIGENTRFHLMLCEMAGQPVALDLVSNLWMRCGPILSHLYDGGIPPNWEPHPHRRIVAAIRAGDAEAARDALIYDIRGNGEGLLAHVAEGLPD
ncbi:GntR family transcriptional regulator [Rhodovulum sp. MB263]|uniref:GntR family transcriptional regulator n=1 Tax=unclassified Rhodovulum TaxID=2631432 RepID=UPI0009B75898|nr:GntR family transcriptional regulator [Rhodovulum sp. MB263]ARC90691.1 GntR family transcriptional regulator [Rhodovulum sp. MB263]